MGDIVPRNQLVKQGVQGIAGIGGGIGLLILKAIASAGFIPGLIAVGAGAVTISSLDSSNRGCRRLADACGRSRTDRRRRDFSVQIPAQLAAPQPVSPSSPPGLVLFGWGQNL